jgi:recombination protein RecT
MTTSASLRAIATGQPSTEVAKRPATLADLLASPKVKAQIATALPRHMTPERMTRIALTELRKTPKLQECEPASFLGAVVQCAQLGLEPGSALGHAYILPFDKRKKVGGTWQTVATEAQVIVGYRGMIDLARRSGQVSSIDARAVHEGDVFECAFGLESSLKHIPNLDDPKRTDKPLRCVYAVARMKEGGTQFEVMSRHEIEAIRGRSKAADSGPWTTDYTAMALKTVIRRLFKYLPVSIELQTAVSLDERGEAGISQDLAMVIDADAAVIPDAPELPEPAAIDPATGEIKPE